MSPLAEIEGKFYNDPPIPESLHDSIHVLDEREVGSFWSELVSSESRHFMLMADHEWPAQIVSSSDPIYFWQDDWNSGRLSHLALKLAGMGVPTEELALIFWMKESGIRTKWGTFCSHWINFLYEDEGCIVLFPHREEAYVFSNGRVWSGRRNAKAAEQDVSPKSDRAGG